MELALSAPGSACFTSRSPSFIALLHTICHIPQLTEPAGAKGNASHHVRGPNHPGGRKNTAALRYHQPTKNCRPVVVNHSTPVNFIPNDDL